MILSGGGVPARRICSLEHYREKRAAAQVEEAKEYVRRFRARWGRDPKPEEMREQFFLWADPDHLNDAYRFQMGLMGSLEKSEEIISTPRPFGSFEEFLASCDDIDGEMIS